MGPMEEIWKDIPGFEGLYQVSDQGRVRSLDRYMPWGKTKVLAKKQGRILTPDVGHRGHRRVTLVKNKNKKRFLVHRLVLWVFSKEPRHGMHVNHIDGDPSNNNLSNLEEVTPLENTRHASSIGLLRPLLGEASPSAKLTTQDVLRVFEMFNSGIKAKDIAAEYSVSTATIFDILRRRTWRHVEAPPGKVD